MDHQLGAAGFVEEAFHRQFALRRQQAERGFRGTEIIDDLARGGFVEADVVA